MERWSWRHPFAEEPEGREVHWWVPFVAVFGGVFVLAFLGYWLTS